ncbi:MAG: DnaD domain protein [Chloroflexota bacterium]|nr:DnaD domain protein [Chloroflexota bacterium]
MSGRFVTFPERMTYVPIPAPFFGPLLQEIDSLAELKLALHVCRRLHEDRGMPRFVRRSELLADRGLLTVLRPGSAAPGDAAVAGALDAAVRRGMLLAVDVRAGGADDVCYLLNTPTNARVADAVRRGERTLGPFGPAPAPTEPDADTEPRPTIFELYEQNIGLLTPLIAEELREAELTYPAPWVEDAFREAVALNRRNWRYVRRILETWASRGRGTRGATGRRPDPAEDPRKYLEGRYGRLVRR